MSIKVQVLEALAESTIFSYEEIEQMLSIWHSYDVVINACELARSTGMSLRMACRTCSVAGMPVLLDPSISRDEIHIVHRR